MSTSLPPRGSPTVSQALDRARRALERFGILLFSDPALPSLVGIIVGEPLRSSWWGHPRGPLIYTAMNQLDDDPEVLATKLVAGKVTYVHRRLWPSVVAIGTAREPWQMDALSAGARWLLDETDTEGAVQTDLLVPPVEERGGKRVAVFARELERRLLVHATEVHTPSGAHAKMLQTWPRWAAEVNVSAPDHSSDAARRELEESAARLASGIPGGVAQLPWKSRVASRPSRARPGPQNRSRAELD
jgi:hypothetical protein